LFDSKVADEIFSGLAGVGWFTTARPGTPAGLTGMNIPTFSQGLKFLPDFQYPKHF
jgi:hypothetical protein